VPVDQLAASVDALAASLAAKPGLVLRTTKAQVDEAVPPVPPGEQSVLAAELAGYEASLVDPECRATAAAYLDARSR
jgi:hypothetical protein